MYNVGEYFRMNGDGDGIQVRYDPDMAHLRRERDNLRIELTKRETCEKDLQKRIRKLERRVNDVTSDASSDKLKHLKSQLVKKDKHIDGIQKYLKKLPTLDEYSQCLTENQNLKSENDMLSKNFTEIKDKLGPYIEKVQSMKRKNTKLEDELNRVLQSNGILEDKLCCKNTSNKENRSDCDLITEIEQHKTIETNLLIRLRKEREERAVERKRFFAVK